MRVFISYSKADADLVAELEGDLRRLGHHVWRDPDLVGGEEWWERICEEIRSADIFVLAATPRSIRSRYCRAEVTWAAAVGCRMLPVTLTDVVSDLLPAELRALQWVSYQERSPESAIALTRALETIGATDRVEPVEGAALPLPPCPLEDVNRLRDQIEAPALTFDQQRSLFDTLAQTFEGTEDVTGDLVRRFRRRPDLAEAVAVDLDTLLDQVQDRSASGLAGRLLAKGLITFIETQRFTPIVGSGLTDSLIGSRRTLAREFARGFEFPMGSHQRDDLAQVAQFVRVMAGDETLRATLAGRLSNQLRQAIGMPPLVGAPQEGEIEELFAKAWDSRPAHRPDPHAVLANLPCPLYITAHPAQLLEHALRQAGKDPVSDICRWRRDVDEWPESPLNTTDPVGYVPTIERPLVYHVFGRLDIPDSLVLTEDDYFEFLIGVSEDRNLIPPLVKRALADSALLILGFRLDDWDSRTMLRALVRQEGSARRRNYKHVAAQVDLAGTVVSPDDARHYLSEYFGKANRPPIEIFWGSVDDFTGLLDGLWSARS